MSESHGQAFAPTSRQPMQLARAPLWAALAISVSCGASPDDAIDREVFIDTYVALRVAALDTDSLRISAIDRDSILADQGVGEDDLERFTEAHAEDLDFLSDVWNDVEVRLDRTPSEGR